MTTMDQDVATGPETTGPTPEDIEAARELPRLLVGRLAGDWHEARARLDRTEELAAMEPTLAPWVAVEAAVLAAVERLLLRAIATAGPAAGRTGARGFHVEGHSFLAVGVGDDPDAWRLLVLPGVTLDLARQFRADRMPAPMGVPTERPAWLVRALDEVGRLGGDEARRRLYGSTSMPSPVGWDEGLHFFFRELGRRETFRRLRLDDGPDART